MPATLQDFSDACRELYAPGLQPSNFARRGFDFLRVLAPAEFIAFAQLDPVTQQLHIGFDSMPPDAFPQAMEAFGGLMGNYALYNFDPTVNDGKPFCRTHFYSNRQFRDLDIFQEVYAPLGIDNHCAIHVPSGNSNILFFGVERKGGPDFSTGELQFLELAQDQLANAYAAAARMDERARTPQPEPDLLRLAGLSPREAEVLFWMCEGKSNAEIALLLGIGLYTVKDHAAAIFDKAGVCNRWAAMAWARQVCGATQRNLQGRADGFIEVTARLSA